VSPCSHLWIDLDTCTGHGRHLLSSAESPNARLSSSHWPLLFFRSELPSCSPFHIRFFLVANFSPLDLGVFSRRENCLRLVMTLSPASFANPLPLFSRAISSVGRWPHCPHFPGDCVFASKVIRPKHFFPIKFLLPFFRAGFARSFFFWLSCQSGPLIAHRAAFHKN